jgi:hypothetical protein
MFFPDSLAAQNDKICCCWCMVEGKKLGLGLFEYAIICMRANSAENLYERTAQ